MSARHYLKLGTPDYTGANRVYGISTWDIPDGSRLRREMQISTRLESVAAIKRWARKYKDVPADDVKAATDHLNQSLNPI